MSDEAPQEKDPVVEHLRDVRARLGEHYDDYLLLVRTKDGLAHTVSDVTWAMGAARRFSGMIESRELAGQIDTMLGGD